nr:hypothetical protein [Tanacetum cinerariifolium]
MWMYSTISPKLMEMVIDDDTSAHGIWKRLKDLFHNNKDARVTQLDNEIRNMAIGSLSVTDFFQEIKSKADRLANLDSSVKDTSLVTYAVNGIQSTDAARVIRLWEKAPTFNELRLMMLLEESDMSHQSVSSRLLHNTPSSPTVLVASTTPTDKANTMSTLGFDVCHNFQRGSCSYGARSVSNYDTSTTKLEHGYWASSHLAENTGKYTRLPFYSSESNVASVDIVHSDSWTSPISSESDKFPFGSMTPDQLPSYDFLPPLNTQVTNPPNRHLSTGTLTPFIHIPTQPHPSQLHFTPHLGPTNEHVTLTDPTTSDPTHVPTPPGPTPNTHLNTPAATTSRNAPNGPTTNTHHMVTHAKAGISKPLARMNCHVTTTSPIPRSHLHALRDPHWHKAMVDEYNALISNETYKARLVANGHSQQQWIDCDETFSRSLNRPLFVQSLSLVVTRDWPIHQLDAKNAFLHGQLSETVYMHQPPSFITRVGFKHNKIDMSLFVYHQGSDIAYLLLYVDDIVLTASSTVLLQRIITLLHAEILERAHMHHCNPCKTPVDTESKLGSDDISYAVQQICLYMHDPRDPHFNALKRILRYVRGTLDHGLQLHVSSASQLTTFTDVDWNGCPVTHRSTFGYCVFLGDNLLSWSAKRQVTLSQSSAEAEYRGVANVVAETAWIRNLLLEFHASLTTATLVYCDNVSAVYLSTNPVQHQRTKHIEIDIHFVRDYVASGQVRVLHVPSRLQYADIFTKGLPTALFLEFRSGRTFEGLPFQLRESISVLCLLRPMAIMSSLP